MTAPSIKQSRPRQAVGRISTRPRTQPKYRPEVIEAILSLRTCRDNFALWCEAVGRFAVILGFFIQIIWMTWWDRQIWSYIGHEDIDRAQSERRHEHGRRITEKLLALGPTFIKVGQALSTRVDLLRKEYIEELSQLQDRVPMFSPEIAQDIIHAELGAPVSAVFETFDPMPIAAASLGQVHRVTLKTGEAAVIKVQRPNLVRLFEIDLCILKKVARFLQHHTELGRGREWVNIVDEFGRTLFEEIDYIREGRHADRFRRNFAGWDNIRIPKIYWKQTARRVITMEYLPGIKINDIEALESADIDRAALSVELVKAYFQQLLLDGFFHADPHPGNIVVGEDGTLILYDFGMVGSIQDETRVKMVHTFLNIVNKRTDAILKNLAELNMLTPGADLEEMRTLIDWALENYYNMPHDQLNFEDLADEMAEVMYYYPFKLPASFTFMFRALITLEGVSTTLYPQIQFMGIAVSYARDFVQNTVLMDRLFNTKSAKGYRDLIKDGLDLLGITEKEKPAASHKVRLYHDEWKPLARYIKAGFLLFAFGHITTLIFLMGFAFLVLQRLYPHHTFVIILLMGTFLGGVSLITFGTLLWLPARKKPILFNPPKRQASPESVLKPRGR